MDARTTFLSWPVMRQLTGKDPLGRGAAAQSAHTQAITPRTVTADRVARSVCPYCAVGCGQRVFVKDEKVVQIEGDPDSPISRGRLCPKGSASKSLVTSPLRQTKVRYRRPVRHRVGGPRPRHGDGHDRRPGASKARADTWQDLDDQGRHGAPHHGHRQPRRGDARQRGELPHQEAVHRDGRASRSRTRRVFDTPPPSPVWGPASVVAAPRTSCRTCPTLTASSSRAPTWPRPTRWASSG